MKKFKRLISAITALAMTTAMFAGLSISAQAAETIVSPTEATYINENNPDTNYADAGVLYANQSKISGGVFSGMLSTYDGTDVTLLKFDVSEYVGRIKSATLKLRSTCTVAGKNSNVQLASVNTNWNADTVTWATQSSTVATASYIGLLGNASSSGQDFSMDVSDNVISDADGIVAYGIYTETGRQQSITNPTLVLDVSDTVIEYTDITVNAKTRDGELIESYKIEGLMVGEPYTITGAPVDLKEYNGALYALGSDQNVNISAVEADMVIDLFFDEQSGVAIVSESFEDLTDTWGFTTGSGVAVTDEGNNKVLTLCSVGGSLKTDTKTFEENVTAAKSVDISFKWKSTADLTAGGGRSSYFALADSDGNAFFGLSGSSNRPAEAFVTQLAYGFSDDYGTYTKIDNPSNNFYTINLSIDFINHKMSGTIADSSGINVAEFSDLNVSADGLAVLKAVNTVSLAPMAIDDFKVIEKTIPNVTFTVTDGEGTPVEGATVAVAGMEATTNASGQAVIGLTDGTYTAKISAPQYMPSTKEVVVNGENLAVDVTLDYVGVTEPATVEISGGEEYIYKPGAGGSNSSEAFVAQVYDNTGMLMESEAVEWSIVNQDGAEGISVADGVVTVTNDFPLTDDNGLDVTVRAAVASKPEVYAEAVIHIRNVAVLKSFTIDGPAVVKDGKTAQYSAIDKKDQYGEPYNGTEETVFSTNNNGVTFDGNTLTAATGTSVQETVTITGNVGGVTASKDIIVYGYDYFEPGRGTATYGSPRMEIINDTPMVVWPASQTANATTTITLPEPVALANGTAKMITFKNIWTTQTVGAQERSLTFNNSKGDAVIAIDFAGGTVVTDFSKVDGNYTGTRIGLLAGNAGEESEATFIIKTDAEGKNSAVLSYNGESIEIADLGQDLGDIASYTMKGGASAPDARLLALVDMKISNSDVKMVELKGADNVARISGKTAKSQYTASIFSQAEGETFTWAVTGDAGVTIDQDGVLYVEESVAPETVVTVSFTSDINPEKTDSKEVTIKDYASVVSYEIEGPIAVNAGGSAQYNVVNIVDEYGAVVDMPVSFEIGSGSDIADITADGYLTGKSASETVYTANQTGSAVKMTAVYRSDGTLESVSTEDISLTEGEVVDMTAPEGQRVFVWNAVSGENAMVPAVTATQSDDYMAGQVVVKAVIGNPGKTVEGTKTVELIKSYITGDVTSDTTNVDISELSNITADTEYRVTVVKNDGSYTVTDDVAAIDGIVTIDTTDAAKYEVSPILVKESVGDARNGVDFAVVDGRYDVTVKKSTGNRGDIIANGYIIGQNVDQYGKFRAPSGSVYTALDVVSDGGLLTISTGGYDKDGYLLDYIIVKQAPTIVERKQHVYILGDSLVSTYYGEVEGVTDSQTGWGQVLDQFINDDVNVTNLAESGNYAQGLYESVFKTVMYAAEPGDILIFECGYNDRNYPSSLGSDTARYENMKNYMQLVNDESKAKGIDLVFVTPNASTHGTAWKADVQGTGHVVAKAEEMGTPYINLAAQSFAYMEPKGVDYCTTNFLATGDNLHSSYLAAMVFAGIVADGLVDLGGNFAGVVNQNAQYELSDAEGTTISIPVEIPTA